MNQINNFINDDIQPITTAANQTVKQVAKEDLPTCLGAALLSFILDYSEHLSFQSNAILNIPPKAGTTSFMSVLIHSANKVTKFKSDPMFATMSAINSVDPLSLLITQNLKKGDSRFNYIMELKAALQSHLRATNKPVNHELMEEILEAILLTLLTQNSIDPVALLRSLADNSQILLEKNVLLYLTPDQFRPTNTTLH